MNQYQKTTLIVGGIIVAVLIILSVLLIFPWAVQRTGPGMMGPGMMGRDEMMRPRGVSVNSEYEFLIHMIPHHEEAVITAETLKDNTEREEMEKFAEDIIRSQSQEIKQMTTWLEDWYPEKDHDIDYQPMMRDLENLKGEELDRAFLEDMIPHHMEAVMMSQQFLSRGLAEHEEVASLARNIRNTQRNEIRMMRSWMARWPGNDQLFGTRTRVMMLGIGLISLLALILLVVLLIKVVFLRPAPGVSSVKSTKGLLEMRYAKGEISREEYLDTRKDLES